MLCSLFYYSRIARDVTKEDLRAILNTSKMRNAEDKITGALVFSRQFFFQVLEGERLRVTQAFSRILRDDRHDSVGIIAVQDIEERQFADWNMLYAGDHDKFQAACQKILGESLLEPDYAPAADLERIFMSMARPVANGAEQEVKL